MRIKKKTLYIVLPLSILVVLLLLLFVFLMGWFGNAPKLNRYDSLIDICEVEKQFFKVFVRCDVFVNETSQKDSKNCLDLTLVNKENTNILPLEVCEKEKVLDISDPVLETDMKVPMHMVFEYTYLPPLSYGISHISMELMEDGEISTVVSGLSKEGMNIQNVRFQERVDLNKKGYQYFESESRMDGLKLGSIKFVNILVNDVKVSKDNVKIELELSIDGVMKEMVVEEPKILFFRKSNTDNLIEITAANLDILDRNNSYDITFLYIPKDGIINEDSIRNFCLQSENDGNAICSIYRSNRLNEYILDKQVEDYIKNSLEKLIFSVLVGNE